MKAKTLAAGLTLALTTLLSCAAAQKPSAPPAPTPEKVLIDDNPASPEAAAALKNFLFADLPLEELLARSDTGGGAREEGEPWRSFAQAVSHSKAGKTVEAKKDLRRVLALPDGETRTLLWAWAALRGMGERPNGADADKVRGVVCELHNEAGVGTIAAYADGRARWLGGGGAVTFWEAPGLDREVDSLIADLLSAAQPLVRRAPASERRAPGEVALEHFRVSILTFGGIHVLDVYGPDIDGKAGYLAPTLTASGKLVNALTERQGREKK
jgi:hypothetical protein